MRERIQLAPDYQRMSDIWTLDKRQLLIDTILNEFDIPKLPLHKFSSPLKKHGRTYDYAIIDGKQRLETVWAFLDGNIALSSEFEYFRDAKIRAGDMTYAELGKAYPDLKVQFDSFQLTTVCIETDELEMIEEMFSRLNESAPLAAPEKRNAYGGPLPVAIRKLATETFFRTDLPFPNKRYRHFDLATKFLLTESEGRWPTPRRSISTSSSRITPMNPGIRCFRFLRRQRRMSDGCRQSLRKGTPCCVRVAW